MKKALLALTLLLGGCTMTMTSPPLENYLMTRSQCRESMRRIEARVEAQQRQIDSVSQTVWNGCPNGSASAQTAK